MRTSKKFRFNKLSFFFIFTSFCCFGQLPPSDTPYLKQKITSNLDLFFSEESKNHSLSLHQYVQSLNKEIEKVFPLSPYYRKNSIVFVSSRNQSSNGTTFIHPLPSIFIYSSPAQIMDYSSIMDWSLDSLAHEIAHLYQINSQTKYSYWLSHFFPFVSWFIYPNIYLHNLFLEGNAVLHESIYGSGGRLFSGWARALVFAQLKSGLSLKRLINKYNDSFSGLEKYLHGGYFYSYLYNKHTLKELNHFFHLNSKNIFLVPLGIYNANRAFKKSLKADFYSSLKDYKEYYKPQAMRQKSSKEPILISSAVSLPLNSDDENIFFLTSDFKSPPNLVVLNKKTQTMNLAKTDLPLGKVFLIDGVPHSAGSGQTSTTKRQFTLFKKGYKPIKKYNSQYVMDILQDKVLSLNTKQSLDQIDLLVNNKFYDNTHSSALMDQKGNIYYFKNKSSKRTLYKNKIPIWSYKGYYGFPVEADKEGLYFIAATKYGSSLFLYSKGSIFRLSPSDTITAARKINETLFLVSEVTSKNYEYKIIKIKKIKEKPYLYKYAFKKKKINKKQIKLENHSPTPYHYLNHWRFQNLFFSIYLSSPRSKSLKIDTVLSLTDSLNYNKLKLQGSINEKIKLFSFYYSNKKYRTSFEVSPTYQKGVLSLESDKEIIDTFRHIKFLQEEDIYEKWIIDKSLNIQIKQKEIPYQSRFINFNFEYPFYKMKHWNISFLKKITLGQKQFNNSKKWIDYFNHFGDLEFIYSKKYSLAFFPYQKFRLKFLYDVLHIQTKKSRYKTYVTGGTNFLFSQYLGKEFYFSTKGIFRKGLWSRKPRSIFRNNPENTILNFHSFKQTVQNFNQISLNIQKVLNQSLYPLYTPIALSRWAPFAGLSLVSFEDKEKGYHYLFNTHLGGNFELVANYKANLNLSFSLGYIWKWKKDFGENKARLHGGVYLQTLL